MVLILHKNLHVRKKFENKPLNDIVYPHLTIDRQTVMRSDIVILFDDKFDQHSILKSRYNKEDTYRFLKSYFNKILTNVHEI